MNGAAAVAESSPPLHPIWFIHELAISPLPSKAGAGEKCAAAGLECRKSLAKLQADPETAKALPRLCFRLF